MSVTFVLVLLTIHAARPLTYFVMEFKEDLLSLEDIGSIRYHLHARGVLYKSEMEVLNKSVSVSFLPNRHDQVYQLLDFLDHKSDGPQQLIKVLREMSCERNFIGEIAEILTKEYSAQIK